MGEFFCTCYGFFVMEDSDSTYDSNVKPLTSGSSALSVIHFNAEWMSKERVFFYVIFMKESVFIWIGTKEMELSNIVVSLHSHVASQPSIAEVFFLFFVVL